MTQSGSGPAVMAKNIELTFSDSGRIQAKLFSNLMQRYIGQISFLEFPKGFTVQIFDSALRVETTISGNYGKRDEQSRIMIAKGNVVVRNILKRQQLNSELLYWDEKTRRIYTKANVGSLPTT
jgi:LPS export ABC transporter protein LptC